MDEIGSGSDIIAQTPYDGNDNRTYLGNIPKGKRAKISLENISTKPAFMMVGNGNADKEKKGTHSMDYTKELLNMTQPEGFMFLLLMKNRIGNDIRNSHIKSNRTYINNSELTRTQKKYISIAYKTLRKKDIIVRTSRMHYIINPRLVISNDNWEEDERLYKETVEKLKNKEEETSN